MGAPGRACPSATSTVGLKLAYVLWLLLQLSMSDRFAAMNRRNRMSLMDQTEPVVVRLSSISRKCWTIAPDLATMRPLSRLNMRFDSWIVQPGK